MAVLVVQIPPRARVAAQAQPAAADAGAGVADPRTEVAYALTDDGLSISSQGHAQLRRLPAANAVVAVLAPTDIAWQRITVPRAPAPKLRAAVASLVEEGLLEETESLHLALEPNWRAGHAAWVAVIDRAWLAGVLEAFDKADIVLDRLVPSIWPGDHARGHFHDAAATTGGTPAPALVLADANGLVNLPLAGTLARALLAPMLTQPVRWTATPAAAAPAERWLGASVHVETETEHFVTAARSLWNLLQFDLTPRRRGMRALRVLMQQAFGPMWRPVRVGLVVLLLAQVVGLNAWAWMSRQSIEQKKQAQVALLKSEFPRVTAVLDPAVQMRHETEGLRTAAGRSGEGDLETMLGAVASAWPEGMGPTQSLRFEPGTLSFGAGGWTEGQIQALGQRLQPAGLRVEAGQGRINISRTAPGR